MTTKPSRNVGVVFHVIGAVGLWLGFYVLGFGLAALLLVLPWTQLSLSGALELSGGVCGLGALWLVWAVFPRFRRQAAREPTSVSEAEQPKLWAFVREVSARVGQPPPGRLVLIPEVNAFARVDRRRFRRTRVVGLGLPLFALLDREGLASVLVHELGHHHAGDLTLGPWLWRTRAAISSTLERLEGSAFWLHLPFVAYGRLFLTLTVPLGRMQEFAADALAARAVGPEATARALRTTHEADMAWDAYFGIDVLPVLRAGRRPPLLEGFAAFRASPSLRAVTATAIETARARAAIARDHDTHPTLAERLSALGKSPDGTDAVSHGRPAAPVDPGGQDSLDLLVDRDHAERRTLGTILRDPSTDLPTIGWDEVAEQVVLPAMRERVQPIRDQLSTLSLERLPEALDDVSSLWASLQQGQVSILSEGARRRVVGQLALAWVFEELVRRGFRLRLVPGQERVFVRGDVEVVPEPILTGLVAGTHGHADWLDLVSRTQ